MPRPAPIATIAIAVVSLAACTTPGSSDPFVGFGPNPPLPAPQRTLLPSVGVPSVVGWPADAGPQAPAGFTVNRFATGLEHPRWLLALPNGDVLVAESAGEPSKADKMQRGIRGFVQKMLMTKVKSAVPSPNKLILLRDQDGDGAAESRTVFAQGLRSPFGMALVDNVLYVANNDGVVRFAYRSGQTKATGPAERVFDLPGPPINHHWTKNVMAVRMGPSSTRPSAPTRTSATTAWRTRSAVRRSGSMTSPRPRAGSSRPGFATPMASISSPARGQCGLSRTSAMRSATTFRQTISPA